MMLLQPQLLPLLMLLLQHQVEVQVEVQVAVEVQVEVIAVHRVNGHFEARQSYPNPSNRLIV